MPPGPIDQDIYAAYGLEPIIEPGDDDRRTGTPGGIEFHVVQCPYCGEPFETLIDLSAGSASYVEDCQVCCQPIDFTVEVDAAGALEKLSTTRGDG